jgi:hypothetical protein
MDNWKVIIRVSPYFPGNENQPKIGTPLQEFIVEADCFGDAVIQAEAIEMGIQANPAATLTERKFAILIFPFLNNKCFCNSTLHEYLGCKHTGRE